MHREAHASLLDARGVNYLRVMSARASLFFSFTLLFAAACSDEPDSTFPDASEPMDAEDEWEAGLPDARRADLGIRDSGRPDRGEAPDAGGDNNDDFDSAETFTIGGNAAEGVIDPAGDVDYFKLEISNTGFLVFDTEANEDSDPMKVDTVLQLFDAQGEQLAQNDDHIEGVAGSLDSEIVYHVVPGTYYVKVQDYSTFGANQTPRGNPMLTYAFSVFQPGGSIVTIDPETGDTLAQASEINQMGFGYLMGTFRDASDVDFFRFTVEDTGAQTFVIDAMPLGPTGFGASPTGIISVYNSDGSQVVARSDVTAEGFEPMQPALTGGQSYILGKQKTDEIS